MCTTPNVTDFCPFCDGIYTWPPGYLGPNKNDHCKDYDPDDYCESTGVREVKRYNKLCKKCRKDPGKRILPHRAYALRK